MRFSSPGKAVCGAAFQSGGDRRQVTNLTGQGARRATRRLDGALRGAIAGAFALLAVGCASAPIDLAGSNSSSQADIVAVSAQEDLRTAAGALRAQAADRGWALDERPALNVLFSRLVGGDGDREGGQAVADYLRRAEARAESTPGATLAGDIVRAGGLADEVSAAAEVIIGARAPLSESGLRRDLSEIESALGALRRARTFFIAAEAAGRDRFAAHEAEAVGIAMDRLEASVERLSAGADALAERRWAAADQAPVS